MEEGAHRHCLISDNKNSPALETWTKNPTVFIPPAFRSILTGILPVQRKIYCSWAAVSDSFAHIHSFNQIR